MSSFSRSRAVLSERGAGKLDKFLIEYDIRTTCKYAVKLLLDGDVHDASAGGGGGAFLSLAPAQLTVAACLVRDVARIGILTESASPIRGCRRGRPPPCSVGRERDRLYYISAR